MNKEFSVLCWNPAGTGMAHIRQVAYKNELETRPDLVFLQEVPVLERNADTYNIDKTIYDTKWAFGKSAYNVILYKKEKFSCVWSEDVETKLKQAYTNIASKRTCAGYISMAMEAEEVTVGSEKEVVTRKVIDILRESRLQPLPELIANIEKVWEDDDFKIDRNRIKYLAGCIKGADTRENGRIKSLLDKHMTMTLLQVRDSPEEKILAVCYHGPRHKNERVLHLLLHLIKEMCKLLEGCPVLLAGDFNMELWHDKDWLKDYLLLDYNPRPYVLTKHREKANCIDHILLWDDGRRDYTCSLKDVRPKMIDITDDMRMDDEDTTSNALISWPTKPDDQANWENIPDEEKPAKLARMQQCLSKKVADEETRKKISHHDPLLARLQVTRRGEIKRENI